jgi:predicted O-linked N-acetylglucosamine transferase (SPINDLY family)
VESVQDKIARSAASLRNGAPAEAAKLCRSILLRHPNHADALNLLGVACYQLGDSRKAVEYGERAVRLRPGAPDYQSNLSRYYLSLGRTKEAAMALEVALQLNPDHAMALFNLASLMVATGRAEEGIGRLREYVARNPNSVVAHNQLGLLLMDQMRPADAIVHLQRAVELSPNSAELHNNLGNAYQAAGRLQDALNHYIRALELKPDNPDAASNIGTVMQSLDRLEDAEQWFHEALRMRPGFFPARGNLAVLYMAQRRYAEVLPIWQQLVTEQPRSHETWNNLGNCLNELGRFDEALNAYREALRVKPNFYPALNNIANVYRQQGRLNEAITAFQQALQADPAFAEGHNNLGVALVEAGRTAEGLAALEKALQLRPDYADPRINLANYARNRGELTKAAQLLREALALKPGNAWAWNNLGCTLTDSGMIGDAIACYSKALELSPDNHQAHSNILLNLHYLPHCPPERIWQEHRNWANRHELPLAKRQSSHQNDPNPNRPLRIGYVSADFRRHSVAFFLEPAIDHHDRSQFELFCYSDVPRPDDYTERFQQAVGQGWRSLCGVNHEDFARMIRQDKIDILVDTGGHTANSRLLSFATKPAPVQVTWIGYPNTTGMHAIDYRLTDAFADPPGATEQWHTETLFRLPETFLCYRPVSETPAVVPSPVAGGAPFTFGSFNNMAKINPALVELWSRILLAAPTTRLYLKNRALGEPQAQQLLIEQFARHGVTADRLILRGQLPGMTEHLAAYGDVDLALDTYPYHGTTTTCESLWMGVPVVSLAGLTHVSRVGCSLLRHAGLGDFVATSDQDYVNKAVWLAAHWAEWVRLRETLRTRLASSPLMDERGFVQNLEHAYRTMWRAWCARSGYEFE